MTSSAVKVTRLPITQAEEIVPALWELRGPYAQLASTTYLVLQKVGGITVDAQEKEEDVELPVPVPGVLIESARFLEHDGFPSVELTVWGTEGEMQVLIVSQPTSVSVLRVEDAR